MVDLVDASFGPHFWSMDGWMDGLVGGKKGKEGGLRRVVREGREEEGRE